MCRAILSSDKQQDSAIYVWVLFSTHISHYYRHHPFYIHSYQHLSCCVVSHWASCQLRYTPFASFCASHVHCDKPFRAMDVVCQNDVENRSLFYFSLTIRHYYVYVIDLTLLHFSVFEFAPEGLPLVRFTLTMGVVASKNCDMFTDKYCCPK